MLVGCLGACLAAGAARAEPPDAAPDVIGPRPEVAILRPPSDDPVLVAASARIQLELGAGGLASALVDSADGFPARVALVREDGVATIDVLGTRVAGAPLHRRVRVPPDEGGGDPAVLAVRAAELLRGIRLDVRRAPAPPAPGPAVAELEAAAPVREPEPAIWRFEAGVGVLSARPVAAALGVGPTVAAAGMIAPHLSITASFAGPFFTNRPATPDGSAHTSEELAGIGLRLDTSRPVLNFHGVGTVGLHHVSATYDARGAPEMQGGLLVLSPQSVWNPALTLAAGASVRLTRTLGVSLQVTAVFVEPALELTSNQRSLGTLGNPSLLPALSAWTTI
jgi:hypothetical protein